MKKYIPKFVCIVTILPFLIGLIPCFWLVFWGLLYGPGEREYREYSLGYFFLLDSAIRNVPRVSDKYSFGSYDDWDDGNTSLKAKFCGITDYNDVYKKLYSYAKNIVDEKKIFFDVESVGRNFNDYQDFSKRQQNYIFIYSDYKKCIYFIKVSY